MQFCKIYIFSFLFQFYQSWELAAILSRRSRENRGKLFRFVNSAPRFSAMIRQDVLYTRNERAVGSCAMPGQSGLDRGSAIYGGYYSITGVGRERERKHARENPASRDL